MALTQITDFAARIASRVISQLRAKARFMSLLAGIAAEIQAAEDALWGYVAQLDLDTAAGVWLEDWGALVGELRQGETDDALYRQYVKARVLANFSHGTIDDVIAVVRKIVEIYGTINPTVTEFQPAAFVLEWPDTTATPGFGFTSSPTDSHLLRVSALIRSARAAGVNAQLQYTTSSWATTFTMATGDTMDADANRGFGNDAHSTGGLFADAFLS